MDMNKESRLAINGGTRTVPEGTIKKWPPIDDIDKEYVLASLRGNNHAFGPNCTKLEEEWAAWNGNRYAITTNSGTAALHMAVAACGCGAGDHVIVPAYSWSSSVTCVIHQNAIPVFVDIELDTMNIDVDKIETAITPKTKAIIVVHLHGLAVNMEKVMQIAKRHKLKVIEDACQAHGAMFKEKKVGHWGDCAAFSFNQNKCLCSGEGGMFVTDNEDLLKRARQVWSFGETRTPVEDRDYHAYALGWMYRNNDMTAAFGRAQLTKLDSYIAIQRTNAEVLLKKLAAVKGLILPVEPKGHFHNWYNFTCHINARALGWSGAPQRLRDAIVKALEAEGVPAGMYQQFILPAMTVFQAKNAYGEGCPWQCPHTEAVNYDLADYPVAQKHCDTHFGMTTPLRAPNDKKAVRRVGVAIRKVFDNVKEINVDEEKGREG